MKLTSEKAELGISGGWCGLRREEKICKNCIKGEMEDVGYFVLRCAYVAKESNLMNGEVEE